MWVLESELRPPAYETNPPTQATSPALNLFILSKTQTERPTQTCGLVNSFKASIQVITSKVLETGPC